MFYPKSWSIVLCLISSASSSLSKIWSQCETNSIINKHCCTWTLRKGIALTTTDNPTYNHFQPLTSQLTTTFNHWQDTLQPLSATDKPAFNQFHPLTSQLAITFNHWQACLQPLTSQLTITFNHGETAQPWWNIWLNLKNHGEMKFHLPFHWVKCSSC